MENIQTRLFMCGACRFVAVDETVLIRLRRVLVPGCTITVPAATSRPVKIP